MAAIAQARLRAQHLVGSPFDSAVELVRHFGAVQSQDYAGAKWALGQRLRGVTEAALDRVFDSGAIVRTHVLRPTWHFVLPEDIGWMLELTGPRVSAGLASRRRELAIDADSIKVAKRALHRALEGGKSLTRTELADVAAGARQSPEGQRGMHLALAAELDGFIISGPRRGKQMTWALMEERVSGARRLSRDEALRELAVRYFTSHGPAQLQDYVWWSGLTQAMARRGVELAGKALTMRPVGGTEYWFDPQLDWRPAGARSVHLLPNFDEYSVAYRDRSALLHADHPFRPELFAFSSILSNIVTVGGELRAAWRKTTTSRGLRIEIRPLRPPAAGERAGVARAVARYSRFVGRPVEIAWL
jgi:hypothetical protein